MTMTSEGRRSKGEGAARTNERGTSEATQKDASPIGAASSSKTASKGERTLMMKEKEGGSFNGPAKSTLAGRLVPFRIWVCLLLVEISPPEGDV